MRTTACCGECYSSFEDDLNPKNGCFVATILDTPLFDHTMLIMGGRGTGQGGFMVNKPQSDAQEQRNVQ